MAAPGPVTKPKREMCPACGARIPAGDGWRSTCPACGEKFEPDKRTTTQTRLQDLKTQVETPAMGTAIATPATGTELPRNIGGFDILDVLGTGGMGVVYLAYEPLLDRQVALKLLGSQYQDPALEAKAARFLDEVVITGKLGHPGIVPIYHVGHDERFGYFYTMRYVKGQTLYKIINDIILKTSGTVQEFTLSKLLNLFQRVCEALSFAHKNGVLHRDLKPSNIMVGEFGEVLVMDWGLAKEMGGNESTQIRDNSIYTKRLTEAHSRRIAATRLFLAHAKIPPTGTTILRHLQNQRKASDQRDDTPIAQVIGTPGFLSPEQGRCDPKMTPASDVYSLGVILYQILAMRSPIEGNAPSEMVANTISGNVIPLQSLPDAHRIPKVLVEITHKALALNPADRYPDAGKLALDMAEYLEGRTPQKLLLIDLFNRNELGPDWSLLKGEPEMRSQGLACPAGTELRCRAVSKGYFECTLDFFAEGGDGEWVLGVGIFDPKDDATEEGYYEIRVGVEDRPFIELRRRGKRVQRRFDVRLQSAMKYSLRIEMDDQHLRAFIGTRKYLEYKESFPLSGGGLEAKIHAGHIMLARLEVWSRGAPLQLPFHYLPDRLFRQNKYEEARELYRELAESHPDREEGLLALYKAGLCSAELKQMPAATQEFTRLHGTLYDHCAALGLAQIGLLDGTIGQAWDELKQGYRKHRDYDIGSEMWVAMLALVERIEGGPDEKVKRYRELMGELDPLPQEMEQITFELLDLIQRTSGLPAMRAQAIALLQAFPHRLDIAAEALWAVCRAGLDETSLNPVRKCLDRAIPLAGAAVAISRFHILYAEILMAEGQLDEADVHLHDAITIGGKDRSEGLWAMGWRLLIKYLRGEYLQALTGIHEEYRRLKHGDLQQLSNYRLIEGLAYLGRKQKEEARRAFERGAEFASPWGYCCRQILEAAPPEAFREKLTRFNRHQFVETLFIAGEAHVLMGNTQLAKEYYQVCVCCERAMISRFAERRLQTLPSK